MDLQFLKGFSDELEKISARRGLKEIRKLVSKGNLEGANRLAKTPNVLKPSAAGSQIRQLGAGAEGAATLTASPQHGVSVRKLFDPAGMSTPEMIARKEQAGRALAGNKNFAQFHGSAQAPGGSPMHFSEYVQGKAMKGLGPGIKNQPGHEAARSTAAKAQKALRSAGFSGGGKDIRMGNMIDSPQGPKVIDYMPAQRGEFMRPAQTAKMTFNGQAVPREALLPKTPNASMLVSGGSVNTPTSNLLRNQLNAPGRPVKPMKASKNVVNQNDITKTHLKQPSMKPAAIAPTDKTPVIQPQG